MELHKAPGHYRPLTEMQNTMQTEASSQAEKEVAGGVTVKHERPPEQEVSLEPSGKENIEKDGVLLRVKTEIKEEMEDEGAPSSCAIEIPGNQIKMRDQAESNPQMDRQSVQSSSKHAEASQDLQNSKAVEGQLTELEPQVAKRRRLTRKTMQKEASNSVKTEVAVKVKKERRDGQEVNSRSSEKKNVEMDDLWQRVKTEIKEEKEQDSGPSSFVIDTPEDQIKMKEETEEDGQPNLGSVQSLSKHSDESAQDRSSKAAVGQLTELEPLVPERRRLTRKTTQIDASSLVKTEVDDSVKVKCERPAEQVVNLQSPEKGKHINRDDLWLQVRREIEKQGVIDSAASAEAASPSAGPRLDANDLEDASKLEDCQDPPAAFAESSASFDAFAKQAATWAKQCLAFRSSQTWSPTRPCCPANFFLASLNGKPSPPCLDAPPCVLRLTGRGLRCLQKFQLKHSQMVTSDGDASLEAEGIWVLRDDFGTQAADPELKVQDYSVHGRDCMKMWPWMRDLPTGVWAGNGWAFDENGLRRLSSPGGSQAMQGVEVFESIGAAEEEEEEEVKQSDERMKQVPVPVSAAEPTASAPPADGQKPARFQRDNLVKQSGVPQVSWNRTLCAWEVGVPKVDCKGNKIGRTKRVFAVKKFVGPGMDEAEADAAALQAAKNFRAELVKQGLLSEPKAKDPNFTSEVPGVRWQKDEQKWRVQICLKGRKVIEGGRFTDKAAAEGKALELRKQHGLERHVKAVSSLAELPVFQPKVPYPGVKWSQAEQQWHAQCRVGGVKRHFRVKPEDHSEEKLQRSFQVAVAWRKKQEKEGETAVKAKAKPQKKQQK